MAVDRTVTVRLRAVNEAYRRAMQEAANDTTRLGVVGTKAFKDLGAATSQLGSSLTRQLTLPLLALGTAATKMGMDFETTFGQMVGLADVPKSEIEGLKAEVMALSRDTAQSPQELAKALYYVRSAGMDAADATDILGISANAAVAGMGNAGEVAKTLTFAMNAYADSGLTAARAADILSAGVREGTFEAADLTQVMGQVIPMASSLGISFETIVGTMAAMSRNGTTTYQAVTGITAVMSTLLSTSKEGEEVLAAHGLSLSKLRDIAAGPGGLVQVFRTLDETFKGNEETLAQVVPNIRALRTFLNVLSQDAGKVDEVMQSVTESTGSFALAVDSVKETKAFKIKEDLNEIRAALTDLGTALLPVVAEFANLAGMGAGVFSGLDEGAQQAAIAFGLLVLVIGPLTKVASMLMVNLSLLAGGAARVGKAIQALAVYFSMARDSAIGAGAAAKMFAADMAAAIAPMLAIGAAVVAATLVIGKLIGMWQEHKRHAAENREEIKEFTEYFLDAADRIEGAGKAIASALDRKTGDDKYDDLRRRLDELGLSAETVETAFAGGAEAIENLRNSIGKGMDVDVMMMDSDVDYVEQFDLLIDRMKKAEAAAESFRQARVRSGEVQPNVNIGVSPDQIAAAEAALAGMATKVDEVGESADVAKDRIDAMLDVFAGMIDDIFGAGDQQRAFASAVADVGKSTASAATSTRNLVQEERDAIRSAEAVTNAKKDQMAAEQALAEARRGASDREKLDAALNVTGANLNVRSAIHAVTLAQKALSDERRKAPKERDMIAANLALANAQLNLRRAQLAAKDANAEQTEVANKGGETTKAVTEAAAALEQATLRVRDAEWAQEAQAYKTNEAVSKGTDTLKDREGQIDNVIKKGQSWIEQLIKLGAPGGEVLNAIFTQASAIDELIKKYGDANGELQKQLELLLKIAIVKGLTPVVNPETGWIYYELPGMPNISTPATGGNRDLGGPVSAGMTYRINESGSEFLTMGAKSGVMTPMSALTSGASGGTSVSAPVTIELDKRKLVSFLVSASHDDGGWNMKIVQR